MKKIFSLLIAALFAFAMVACDPNDLINPTDSTDPADTTGGGGGGNGDVPAVTDTTIMNFTLMRSLIDIDWDEACTTVLAMGFAEITPDEDNVRSFMIGSVTGDYYTCNLRCDFPEVDNLVGAVVIHEHHMNSSTQATCLENNIYLIYDERRVLDDMTRDAVNCGGNIIWGDMQDNGQWDGPHESLYPHADGLDGFVTDSRAMETHSTVNANWADTYFYNNMRYTASCSSISNTQPNVTITGNIITLSIEELLDK